MGSHCHKSCHSEHALSPLPPPPHLLWNLLQFGSLFTSKVNFPLFSPSTHLIKLQKASRIHNSPHYPPLNSMLSGNRRRLIIFGWHACINSSCPWIGTDGPHVLHPTVCLHPLPTLKWTFLWENKKPTCHPGWEINRSCIPALHPRHGRQEHTQRGFQQQAVFPASLERLPEPEDTNVLPRVR